MGSIHATVNRIWTIPGARVKVDVQFISKTTVLFRIDNEALRQKVLRRRYWHVADVPLVVNVWTPETTASPPDLTAMPLWVDLKGVPSSLFSHKGLICVSSLVGKFVKLHPFTERCTRLDIAKILLDVNLHEPLVESVTFTDNAGTKVEVEVSFPLLPSRCNVCQRWGHKRIECTSKQVVVFGRETRREVTEDNTFGSEEQEVDVEKTTPTKTSVGPLFAELEALPIRSETEQEKASEETEKGDSKDWTDIRQRDYPSLDDPEVAKVSFDVKHQSPDATISPSRFKVLETLNEENEIENIEEGEFIEEEE